MDNKNLIVINAGSSSIKFALYALNQTLDKRLYGIIENVRLSPSLKLFDQENQLIRNKSFDKKCDYQYFYTLLLSLFKNDFPQFPVTAAGHRVVHGGSDFYAPTLISNNVMYELKKLIPFAPLHQQYNLEAIEAIAHIAPDLPQIACFDTAFHRTHPPIADAFGLPQALTEEGIKRYGFHGLSYEFMMHQLQQMHAPQINGRIVMAHLGNGASMCAVKNGKAQDSTMGFTALDGLLMGTRCGSLDPGVILYLLEFKNMSVTEIQNLLYNQSGLLGVSGITSNMKQLLEDKRIEAKQALDLFVYRIRRELGALSAVIGGLDALVFTGGIGEHAWPIREAACKDNEWLGVKIDRQCNQENQLKISTQDSKVVVYVIPTNEEWIIAKHCKQLLEK